MWSRLKEKHTVLLVTRQSFDEGPVTNYVTPADTPLTLWLAGGNLLWSLIYEVSSSIRPITVQSGHLTCHQCLRTEHEFPCSDVHGCLVTMERAYKAMKQDGRSIRWPTRPQPHSILTGTYDPAEEACLFARSEGAVDCQHLNPKNILINYMLECLNRSDLGSHLDSAVLWQLTPSITWSEDDMRIEEQALVRLLPLYIFPAYNSIKLRPHGNPNLGHPAYNRSDLL